MLREIDLTEKLTLAVKKGKAYWYKDKIERMLGFFEAMSLIVEEPFYLRRVYINLGIAHRSVGEIDEAIESYMKALEIEDEPSESDMIACRQNLGNALLDARRFDEALAFLEESENYFRQAKDAEYGFRLSENYFRQAKDAEYGFRLGTTLETKARALLAQGKDARATINEAMILLLTHCPDSPAVEQAWQTRGLCFVADREP